MGREAGGGRQSAGGGPRQPRRSHPSLAARAPAPQDARAGCRREVGGGAGRGLPAGGGGMPRPWGGGWRAGPSRLPHLPPRRAPHFQAARGLRLCQYIIIILGKTGRAYEVENCISFVLNLPKSKSSGRYFDFTYLLMGSVSYCPKMLNIQKESDSPSGLNSS